MRGGERGKRERGGQRGTEGEREGQGYSYGVNYK